MIEFWLLGSGHVILFAIGVATWMEESLLGKRHQLRELPGA
jgi:hypothetical protein